MTLEDKKLLDQEERAKEFENLLDVLDDDLDEVRKLINEIKAKAKDYNGFDFVEAVEECIKDMV